MVKTYNIIRKVEDSTEFEEFFLGKVLPLIFKTKSRQVKVTKVVPLMKKQDEMLEGIQYIIESYYDSLEVVDETVHSEEGLEVMKASSQMPGELSVFIAQEKFIQSPKNDPFDREKPIKRF